MTAPQRRPLIPLYDATADLACTISDGDAAERIELLERMRTDLQRLDRTEHGMLLHFDLTPATEADVRRFAVEEKACCQFWGFEVSTDDGLTLRWDAPPTAADLIERLGEFLTGSASISDLQGLL